MAGPTVLSWSGQDVDITTVERQFSALWKELAADEAGVCLVRTHVFNLVVHAASRAQADELVQRLSRLQERQPSRTIVVCGERTERSTGIDVEVSVTCPPGSGDRPARCFERLTIRARGRAGDHLNSVVVPLLIPELRTYLWWPGQPPFGHRSFHTLLGLADQLVIDSAEFTSPGDGLANVARLASGRQGVNDFHWGRLASWREILMQFFDGPHVRYARTVRRVNAEFGAGGGNDAAQYATAGLLLLLGWAGHAFGWEPETALDGLLTDDVELSALQENRLIPVSVSFHDRGRRARGRMMRLELECGAPDTGIARFAVERSDDLATGKVSVAVPDEPAIERIVPLHVRSDVELLVDELELSGHDNLYEVSAELASRFAGRVLWAPA